MPQTETIYRLLKALSLEFTVGREEGRQFCFFVCLFVCFTNSMGKHISPLFFNRGIKCTNKEYKLKCTLNELYVCVYIYTHTYIHTHICVTTTQIKI